MLGNHYFPALEELYDVYHTTQADMVAAEGDFFCDISVHLNRINFWPDLLLITDESLPPLYTGLEKLDIPLIGYLIDSHIHFSWHQHFAGVFDHCFIAQKNYCKAINQFHNNCSWLPLFAPADMSATGVRDIGISFVGTLDPRLNPERVAFIDSFRQKMNLTVAHGAYQQIFNRSRIILNQSVRDDINFRVFEAMACGGMLLTDNVGNGLEELFTDGVHVVLYEKGDVQDAINKARYFLQHETERQRIANAGNLAVASRHTAMQRTQIVHATIQRFVNESPKKLKQRVKSMDETYRNVIARYRFEQIKLQGTM